MLLLAVLTCFTRAWYGYGIRHPPLLVLLLGGHAGLPRGSILLRCAAETDFELKVRVAGGGAASSLRWRGALDGNPDSRRDGFREGERTGHSRLKLK